jgi:hypothetical protein
MEVDLCLWAWKRRTGLIGQYGSAFSGGHVSKWEQRSVVVAGSTLAYYKAGEEDGVPRGSLDLLRDQVEMQVVAPFDDAPTQHCVNIQAARLDVESEKTSTVEWKFCFDRQEDLIRFLDTVHTQQDLLGAYIAKDVNRFEHDFHEADHIFRWEMIVCPPVIYPIQIHGIVLSAGRNCVVVADFGLTGYGRKKGEDFNHADERHNNAILTAWRKLRPEQDQRLNIVTLTDPMEIRKWHRARYDEESLFGGKKSAHRKTFKKISAFMGKLKLSRSSSNRDDTSSRCGGESSSRGGGGENNSCSLRDTSLTSEDGSAAEVDIKEVKSTDSSSSVGGGGVDELPMADPKDIVLARANFLLEHMEALPPYHVFYSNSECIAVWCKTGRWSTLQTAVFLSTNSVGAAKTSTLTTLAVAAANPVLAPLVAVGGLIWVSAPMVILQKSREKWEEATKQMTDLFWDWAPPLVYVAAIEHWSGLLSSSSSMPEPPSPKNKLIQQDKSTSSS